MVLFAIISVLSAHSNTFLPMTTLPWVWAYNTLMVVRPGFILQYLVVPRSCEPTGVIITLLLETYLCHYNCLYHRVNKWAMCWVFPQQVTYFCIMSVSSIAWMTIYAACNLVYTIYWKYLVVKSFRGWHQPQKLNSRNLFYNEYFLWSHVQLWSRWLFERDGLPYLRGSLSSPVPSQPITQANQVVQEAICGPYK